MVAVVVDTRCVKLSAIKLGTRHRKDLGNVKGLAESIKSHGLFHPVGITPDNELIFGYRRLEAVKSLGWTEIEARVLPLDSILEGEHDENECRKEFTPSERVAIADALRSFHHGGDRKTRENTGKNQEQKFALDPATAEEAAKKAGLGNKETARQAKSVVESGTPELVEAMDAGEVSISAASKLAELPKPEQQKAVKRIKSGEKPAAVVKDVAPEGKCPACAGTKWKHGKDGWTCAKCHHPHGEPAGDTDAGRLATQRSKTVKTCEALMRAFDDLNLLRPKKTEAIRLCKDLLAIAKEWK